MDKPTLRTGNNGTRLFTVAFFYMLPKSFQFSHNSLGGSFSYKNLAATEVAIANEINALPCMEQVLFGKPEKKFFLAEFFDGISNAFQPFLIIAKNKEIVAIPEIRGNAKFLLYVGV